MLTSMRTCTSLTHSSLAAQMQAYRVLLTHFSQRYHAVPSFSNTHQHSSQTVAAFDGLSMNLLQLPLLPLCMPVLVRLFARHHTSHHTSEAATAQFVPKRPKVYSRAQPRTHAAGTLSVASSQQQLDHAPTSDTTVTPPAPRNASSIPTDTVGTQSAQCVGPSQPTHVFFDSD